MIGTSGEPVDEPEQQRVELRAGEWASMTGCILPGRLLPGCALLLLGGLMAGSVSAGVEPRAPLNVLLIAVDDLRPELGCYGNRVVHSPHIDGLARQGTVFTHAYCQQAVCSPSRTSLMTGRYPDATRVWDLKTHFRVALPDGVTLPEHFKANGYHCVSLGKIYHRGLEDGRSWSEPAWYASGLTVDTDPADHTRRRVERFGPGVSEFDETDGGMEPKRRPQGYRPAFEASAKDADALPDGATAAEAVRRLRQLKAQPRPFFLAVGFVKPHLPFVAPRAYWDLYDPEDLPKPLRDRLPEGAPDFAGHNNHELHSYSNIPAGNPIPEPLASQLRHGYYACVSFVDAQVGRLLHALEAEGLADSTVVVLWGDHGWQLGDLGLWVKHTNFERATRAPLILRVPGQQRTGTLCSSPVEFVDIYPTLVDVCGLEPPAVLDGRSLRPLLDDPSGVVRTVALSQYPRGGSSDTNPPLMGYSLRDSQWRLTLWRDRRNGDVVATELYDELNDPAESRNLAGMHPEVVSRLAVFCPELPPADVLAGAPADTRVSRGPSGLGRDELFARKDRDQDGRLALGEFLAHQQDVPAAETRFEKWDANQDGFLTETEFVRKGSVRTAPGDNQ
jgi:arylsulfatase A-like enzyme